MKNFWWWKKPLTATPLESARGHLEAGETLLAAAERELYEETGIRAVPDALLKIHQWVAPDGTPFIRFLFRVLLE